MICTLNEIIITSFKSSNLWDRVWYSSLWLRFATMNALIHKKERSLYYYFSLWNSYDKHRELWTLLWHSERVRFLQLVRIIKNTSKLISISLIDLVMLSLYTTLTKKIAFCHFAVDGPLCNSWQNSYKSNSFLKSNENVLIWDSLGDFIFLFSWSHAYLIFFIWCDTHSPKMALLTQKSFA